MKLASRAQRLKPSATLLITAKAKALKADGIDVVGFGAGEPDFDTPMNIKDEAKKAINNGFTKYTAVGGTDELKYAIIYRLKEDYGLTYDKSQIMVSCGAKHTLYNLTQVIIDEGDEVIIPSPYWVSYPEQVTLAGGTPVIIETREEEGFKIDPDELKKKITSRTKAFILNYPSNPTGATYNEEDLREIAGIALDAGLIIISDEIYDKIIYDGLTHTPIATIGEDVKESTILVNGVSKSYSMTGWRIGYSAGDKDVSSAMSKLQGQSTSNPTSISQIAAIEAFKGPQDEVAKMVKEFEIRKNYIAKRLNDIPGMKCFHPQGAFYVFPNVSNFYGKSYNGKGIRNSVDFSEYLLDVAKVAVVPGIEFGSDKHVRISYAASMEEIIKGVGRIEEALEKLR
ncbi:MAG TPA: pyridoxal phosphate-dependent aminotransferase [Thermodesulfobacteriota bacterium]|jgi:aspartate aminotransferase